jgi:hypothetical protein
MRLQNKHSLFHWVLISFFAIFSSQALAIKSGCESLAQTAWHGNFSDINHKSNVKEFKIAIEDIQPISRYTRDIYYITGTINGISIAAGSQCFDQEHVVVIQIVTPEIVTADEKIPRVLIYKPSLKDNFSIKEVFLDIKVDQNIYAWFMGNLLKS